MTPRQSSPASRAAAILRRHGGDEPAGGSADLGGELGAPACRDGRVGLRQQPPAGHGDDAAGEPFAAQGRHRIHHGQAGADHQDVARRIEGAERFRTPRIEPVPARHDRRTRKVAHRQDQARHRPGRNAHPVQDEALRHRLHVDDRRRKRDQPVAGARRHAGPALRQVAAVEPARREGAGLGLADPPPLLCAEGRARQPIREVLGPLGIGAHLARPEIQQMLRVGGGVGEPEAEGAAALAEQHRTIRRQGAQQLLRRHQAAETAADDRDGTWPVGRGHGGGSRSWWAPGSYEGSLKRTSRGAEAR